MCNKTKRWKSVVQKIAKLCQSCLTFCMHKLQKKNFCKSNYNWGLLLKNGQLLCAMLYLKTIKCTIATDNFGILYFFDNFFLVKNFINTIGIESWCTMTIDKFLCQVCSGHLFCANTVDNLSFANLE